MYLFIKTQNLSVNVIISSNIRFEICVCAGCAHEEVAVDVPSIGGNLQSWNFAVIKINMKFIHYHYFNIHIGGIQIMNLKKI